MTTPTPDPSAGVQAIAIPVDPQQRYLLVLQTPNRLSSEQNRHIATQLRQWWDSDEPFLLVNVLPDESVRLERIET